MTKEEERYLAIYFQVYSLTPTHKHAKRVYAIKDYELSDYKTSIPIAFKHNKKLLDNKFIYFPYDMLQLSKNSTTTSIEAIVVKKSSTFSLTRYYLIPLSIDGHSLIEQAQAYWQSLDRSNTTVTSERKETALEYDLRLSNIYYIESAVYLCLSIALLSFAAANDGGVFYFYLLLSLIAIGFTFRQFYRTYQKHKNLQPVLTVRGLLNIFKFEPIGTFFLSNSQPCIGSRYYLNIPLHVKRDSLNIFDKDKNEVVDFQADITAHKSSGYSLLNTKGSPSSENLAKKIKTSTHVRISLFLIIMLITWVTMDAKFVNKENSGYTVVGNVLAIIFEPYAESKTYTSSQQLFEDPPPHGIPIKLIIAEPVACRLVNSGYEVYPDCRYFYLNPSSSFFNLPPTPKYIEEMINSDYPHRVEKNTMNAAVASIRDVKVLVSIHSPLFIEYINKACRFDNAFECSVIYNKLNSLVKPYEKSHNNLNNDQVNLDADGLRKHVDAMFDRPVIRVDSSIHKEFEEAIADWAATSMAQYFEEFYRKEQNEYMASDVPKVAIKIDSYDLFKTGSLEPEYADTTNIRKNDNREFILSGRVLSKDKSDNSLNLEIYSNDGYVILTKDRKQSIPKLLMLIITALSFFIILYLSYTKPTVRKRLTAKSYYLKRTSSRWKKKKW